MANTKKHILFITPAFPDTVENSHSVTYFANFIKAYRKKNTDHKISIISLQLPAERKNYDYAGADIFALGTYGLAKWKKIITWQKVLKLAKQIDDKNKVSIVHALWLKECALISNKISKKLDVHAIYTVMGMELRGKNRFLKFMNLKKMHLVFVSPRHYMLHKEQLTETKLVDIIPWGINSKTINKDLNHQKKYDILFVGFLNDNKNLSLFVQIIEELKKQKSTIKALVIGDFFNLQEWKTKIASMNLIEQIEFRGILPNEEVLAAMRDSKILLHPSNYESLGYVMLEALSQGMYVVSKEVGIAKSSSRWIICKEPEEFVKSIHHLLENHIPLIGTTPHPLTKTVNSYSSLYSKYSD